VVSDTVLDTITFIEQGITLDVTFNIDNSFPSGTPYRYVDLQRIMLHELGHCFQIRHTSNIGDIMGSGRINPALDNPSRSFSGNDHGAALHVKALSQIGACLWDGMIPYPHACTNSVSSEIDNKPIFEVYPNPSNGSFSISFENEVKNGTLEILNISGNLILGENVNNKENLQLDISKHLVNGIYLLRLRTEEGEYLTKKIIINEN